ncbi:putative carbohydrate esterase isoform X1 [Iris pallida]|uniref:Carbohydrate esterase isoform X1 n=1 Tax=Iris pallida TaxID=29817 RepID=A0AAX6HH49_IRIPA|nr:putative carbohydrate esterase isoform X1 [Iris pallida]
MNSFLFLLLLLHFLSSISMGRSQTTVPSLIFVLAGQSNMAGRGGVSHGVWDRVVPPESRPSPSVLRLDAALRWVEAREPLHADVDRGRTCGVGPGLPFANSVRPAAGAAAVGLVPCAVGGTRIAEWARGTEHYETMMRRAKAAAEGGRVEGVVWYQGESDTREREDADMYRGRMEQLVMDVRDDLAHPSLLFIQVALASGEGNFTEIVREAQKGISLPNVICVDAKGLPLQDDHLHLTTQAQVQLGKMLATAYLNHVGKK